MEIVLSGENRYDQYGNFWFKDKAGEEHKVGAKNRKKDELVRVVVGSPNCAVKLIFDTVKGKDGKDYDYISGIELLELKVDETKITEQQVKPQSRETASEPAPQAVGMCTKEMGDMIRAKYLKPLFGDEAYLELIKWYRGQILSITRIPYDGTKLPKFDTKKED